MHRPTLKRIVRMSFKPEKNKDFLDKSEPNIFFTYSFWKNEAALEAYRNSELFKNTWAKTKVLFNEKPQAWSVEMLEIVTL